MEFKPRDIEFSKVLDISIPFEIQRYQRNYGWNKKEWQDLFEDVLLSVQGNSQLKYHFIGSLIFEDKKNDNDIQNIDI